ncbi:MAG: hypothetical protein IJ443_06800 [Firmicutes bacterium]|nr:hypothetical protein [Bacillota bacterium]
MGLTTQGRAAFSKSYSAGTATESVCTRRCSSRLLFSRSMASGVPMQSPVTAENRGFINRHFISQMKDGAILINTARGALINEADLAEALRSGKISAAGIDVLDGEPPRRDNPLIGAPNCFITSHIAWASREARNTICCVSAQNLQSWLDGGMLNRIV